MLDSVLMALYIGALLTTTGKRDAAIALACFSASYAIAGVEFAATYQYHLSLSMVAVLGALVASSYSVRLCFFAIVLYQYLMSFDALIWPDTITVLYTSYPYVAFMLNIVLLGCVGGGFGISNSRGSVRGCWRFSFPRMALRIARKERMQKSGSQ